MSNKSDQSKIYPAMSDSESDTKALTTVPPSQIPSNNKETTIDIDEKGGLRSARGKEVEIVFKNLSYSISLPAPPGSGSKKNMSAKKEMITKTILKGINGVFKPGRLCAVMGASGAGKTSFLQVLAGEARSGEINGQIMLNSTPIYGKEIKKCSGFVFQDDVILATMTVREAITMSALLRLPQEWDLQLKHDKVEEVIRLLGLEKAANTIIGDTEKKGISGGERKRTAMAMEILTDPQILFLDEPTSGLDTFTAFAVIKILSDLARGGRTIVATIHQPSSEIFHLFDDLILMADGKVMYGGPCESVIEYFGARGYPCPQYSNPADYLFMTVLNNTDGSENEALSDATTPKENNQERIVRLLGLYETSAEATRVKNQCDNPATGGVKVESKKKSSSFKVQFVYLFGRAAKNAIRDPLIVKSKLIQAIVIALIVGFIFLNSGSTTGTTSTQNRSGVLFFAATNNVMSSCISILSIFGGEKAVFTREHGAGYYGLPAYFFSKTLVEVPYQILFPFIQATIIYWMVGLQAAASKYIICCCFVILASITGWALGIFFACVFPSLPIALAATPVILMPLMLFSGLFANINSIPVWLRWIQWISPIKYAYEGMLKNEYYGIQLYCNGAIPVDGSYCIASQGLDDGLDVWACAIILIAMVVFFLVLAFNSLNNLVSHRKSMAVHKGQPNEKRFFKQKSFK